MRKITKEEKRIFYDAMRQTNGINLHGFKIILWSIFLPRKFWVFIEKLKNGMNWWSAYDDTKKN